MSARVRIVNVRPKLSVVRALPSQAERDEKAIRREIEDTIVNHLAHSQLAGMMILIWGPELSSTVGMWAGASSTLPRIVAADYFRNRINAQVTENWTIDAVNASLRG